MPTVNTMTRRQTIERNAAAFEATLKDCYYLEDDDGEDYGVEFCEPCAVKVIAEEGEKGEVWHKYRSAWDAQHDTRSSCDKCDCHLRGHLTDYGAFSELDGFEEYGFDADNPDHCWSFTLCEMAFVQGSEAHRRLLKVAGLEMDGAA